MLLITGHLPKNTSYGMQQLQHYSFGQMISTPDTQQHHQEGVHSLLLWWFFPAPGTHRRRSIIQSLHDHLEWCLWMGAHLRRYGIWEWEWKFKCSHSSMLRTMTISCFNTRKFIFWTCHSQSMSISWLPPCSVPPTDLMMNLHLITHLRMTFWLATCPT